MIYRSDMSLLSQFAYYVELMFSFSLTFRDEEKLSLGCMHFKSSCFTLLSFVLRKF